MLALLLIAPLFAAIAPAAPALADDPPGDTAPGDSAIGDGGNSPLGEYIQGSIVNNGTSELTVGNVSDNACAKLIGTVTPADIPEQYQTDPPQGKGQWEFQVCAQDGATSQQLANRYPTVEQAKAYCASNGRRPPSPDKIPCVVFVYWHPEVRTPPPAPDEGRNNYFRSFFQFSPDLGTSPHNGDLGLIANFPTWYWNKVETRFPKAIGDLGLFGGLAATAWHLNTTLDTNDANGRICSVSGLRKVGREWDASKYRPDQVSPQCGHTYHNMGIYNVHGCSQWLIIAVGPFFAIAFPITVCSDTSMTVKESQIVTGGDARRAPTR